MTSLPKLNPTPSEDTELTYSNYSRAGDSAQKRMDKEVETTVRKSDDRTNDILEEYDDCSDAQDDFVLVSGEDENTVNPRRHEALDRRTVIHECARTLLLNLLERQKLGFDEIYRIFVSGFEALHMCADAWDSRKGKPIKSVTKDILLSIRNLPRASQFAFHRVLQGLTKATDWSADDAKVVNEAHFEISKAIWLLLVGPQGLLVGWERGFCVDEIALTQENHWIDGVFGDEESKEVLQDFAVNLRCWGCEMGDLLKKKPEGDDI